MIVLTSLPEWVLRVHCAILKHVVTLMRVLNNADIRELCTEFVSLAILSVNFVCEILPAQLFGFLNCCEWNRCDAKGKASSLDCRT